MRRALGLALLASLSACGRSEPPPQITPAPSTPSSPTSDAVVTAPEPDTTTTAPEPEPDVPKAETMGWVVLAPEGGGFRVELPVEPNEQRNVASGPTGLTTSFLQWNATDPVSGVILVVAMAPLVEQLVRYGDSELALERSIRQLQKPGLTVDSVTRITLDGFVGREAGITVTGGGQSGSGLIRVYQVGLRVYQLLGVWFDESGKTETLKAFGTFALDADAATLEQHPVDLWRRFEVPDGRSAGGGAGIDVELPGKPDAATVLRDTPFGSRDVDSLTLLSSFPPAAYGVNVLVLGADDATRAPSDLLKAWAAAITPKPASQAARKVLGDTAASMIVQADGSARLAFVRDGRIYELVWQPLPGRGTAKASDAERDRFFRSPRLQETTP